MRRLVSAAVVLLLAVSAGQGQSLAEAAKKEKERRAAYKNKPTVVLTDSGLSRLDKQAAISTPSPEVLAPEAGPHQAENSNISRTIVPQMSTVRSTPPAKQNADSSGGGATGNLESRWQKAKEYADLLELKMNALWQEFYSMDDMTSRDKIQQDISLTFEKYTQAREEEARALADFQKQKSGQD